MAVASASERCEYARLVGGWTPMSAGGQPVLAIDLGVDPTGRKSKPHTPLPASLVGNLFAHVWASSYNRHNCFGGTRS
jgi:hypothetical protein